jgi:hypothetical protein
MPTLNRREFFPAFAAGAALWTAMASKSLADIPLSLDRWASDIADLNRDLSQGKIALTTWQDRMIALDAGIDIAALRKYLDFERLSSALEITSNLAETSDPKFPATINVAGIERPWFIRFFGMRKGGAIIPHVHNNMVSSHLVVQGSFRARTFDRVQDLADAVVLRPVRNGTLPEGGIITMSDDRENAHWLIAQEDRSFTFDVGMVSLSKTRIYGLKANKYSMIFVDPTGAAASDGTVTAPVITFDECAAKFAP